MNLRVSRASGLAATLLALPLLLTSAAAQLGISSNDNKAVLVNGVNAVPPNPADDTVTLIDLGVSPPKVVGELGEVHALIAQTSVDPGAFRVPTHRARTRHCGTPFCIPASPS